ncbi:uncharacterized protein LOC128922693 [Zeugodacus cucurbitae]|uniref:uncharacterized protein LOC128922693 n=1 Tax=Zeugodacus cucurbitae TaxID=28588 RepID=UPI0023D937C8|nr:uncharacterized protein LOC128922693 [Zeugodacus cucurbitae]XP_054090083.1 uncharacterized protein LOC128922693 [Zeugodacus cucurbitae]
MFSKRHMRRLIKNEESEFYGMAENDSEEDAVNCSEFYEMTEDDSEEDAVNCSFDNIDAEVEFFEKEESSQKTNCDKLIEKLKMWTARHKVTRNCFDDLLKILQSENISVPTSSKGILRQATCRLRTVAPGNYLHIGLEKQLRSIAITLSDVDKFEIDIGIDGLPLYKSSNVSLWPILAKLHPKRNTKVMLIGVFEGKQKPADVNNYLHDFAYELKTLTQYGMEVNGRRIKVKVRCFICDAPARAFICQTVGHNSFQGCSKCTQVGKKINHTITYSTLTENLRTDDDFAARNSVGHHKKMEKSCLEEIGVGMVSAFPVEPMHLLDLGVVRKMLKCLINGPNVGYQLTKQQKNMLSKTLISYIPYIPNEFARKPRSLDEIARWKAIEFRQFVLYTGMVALKDIVSDSIYYHFSLLHCAYALLSSQKTYENNLEEIKLNYFVHLFPTFYGEEKVSYNVHSVLHLVDSVKSCGFLNSFSAYAFENFLQTLKRFVKRPRETLQQINNRYQYENVFTKDRYVGPKVNRCGKVIRFYGNDFNISDKLPDNFCYVKPGVAIQIIRLSKKDDDLYMHGKVLKNCCNLFTEPLKSMIDLGVYIADIDTEEAEQIYDVQLILYKLMCLPYNNQFLFLPIIHSKDL